MVETAPFLLLISIGFMFIGCLTLYFATRRRAFVRTFINPGNREAMKRILRNKDFARGMRSIAYLQIGVALLMSLGALIAWLLDG